MIEIAIKKALAANCELRKKPSLPLTEPHISVRDRFTDSAVFLSVGADKLTEESFSAISIKDGSVIPSGTSELEDTDGSDASRLPDDVPVHLALYKKYPQIKAIAHVHFLKSHAFSQAGKDIPVLERNHAVSFRDTIRCTRPAKDAAESADGKVREALNALEGHEVLPFGALLLHGDGALVWHETPLKALEYSERLESVADSALSVIAVSGYDAPTMSAETAAALFGEAQHRADAVRQPGPIGSKVTFEQMRSVNLSLLEYFDKICRENGIKYSLTGGSLIGAVRHGGMIPWDDDADVFLTRPEFEKLETAFPEDGRYQYVTLNKDPNFNYVFGRLIDTWTLIEYSGNTAGAGKGLFLDVCVVDGLPKSALLRTIHMKHMRLLVRLRRALIQDPGTRRYKQKGPLFVLAKWILRHVSSLHHWNRRMSRVMRKYPFDTSEYVGNFTSQYGARELLHASVFDNYFDVEFEHLTCMICKGYDEYLTNIYHNYLAFPKAAKQAPSHNSNAIWVGPTENE